MLINLGDLSYMFDSFKIVDICNNVAIIHNNLSFNLPKPRIKDHHDKPLPCGFDTLTCCYTHL